MALSFSPHFVKNRDFRIVSTMCFNRVPQQRNSIRKSFSKNPLERIFAMRKSSNVAAHAGVSVCCGISIFGISIFGILCLMTEEF